jgi:hypothetical protein
VKRWNFPEPTNYCTDWEERKGCAECGNYMIRNLVRRYPSVANLSLLQSLKKKLGQTSILDYAGAEP